MFKAYALSKSRSYIDATIPVMIYPEMLHNLPKVFYIGLGTNPLNRARPGLNGQGMLAFAAVQLVQASLIYIYIYIYIYI